MNWQGIIVLALIVEGIVTNLKFLWSAEEFCVSRLVALIVSILIAILTNADLFPLVNLPISIPFVGAGLTGIVVSSGANFVYDLWNKLTNLKS